MINDSNCFMTPKLYIPETQNQIAVFLNLFVFYIYFCSNYLIVIIV